MNLGKKETDDPVKGYATDGKDGKIRAMETAASGQGGKGR